MNLVCELKVAMQLHQSRDKSVCVSASTSYDFNALTPVA